MASFKSIPIPPSKPLKYNRKCLDKLIFINQICQMPDIKIPNICTEINPVEYITTLFSDTIISNKVLYLFNKDFKIINVSLTYKIVDNKPKIIDFREVYYNDLISDKLYIIISFNKQGKKGGHSNACIIDLNKRIGEYFEPHGQYYKKSNSITKMIINWIENYIYQKYNFTIKLTSPQKSCPIAKKGPQNILKGPFCASWSLLY